VRRQRVDEGSEEKKADESMEASRGLDSNHAGLSLSVKLPSEAKRDASLHKTDRNAWGERTIAGAAVTKAAF
jgi:hypothetical protein